MEFQEFFVLPHRQRKGKQMLFKKKKNGPVDLRLDENQFAKILDIKADDVGTKYCIIAQADHYYLLYRDGRFLGMPCPYGGAIYPFSLDPTKPGSGSQKKQFNAARIVCLSNAYNVNVLWGTRENRVLEDPITKEKYMYGANGSFYAKIEEKDAAQSADKFYRKILSQHSNEAYTYENLRTKLGDAFIPKIGAAIQDYVDENKVSLASFVGLNDKELQAISSTVCKKIINVFDEYGIVIVESASCDSVIKKVFVVM